MVTVAEAQVALKKAQVRSKANCDIRIRLEIADIKEAYYVWLYVQYAKGKDRLDGYTEVLLEVL